MSFVRTYKKVISLQLIFHWERNIIRSSVFFENCVLSRGFDDIITNFRTSKLCEKVTAIEVIYKTRVFWRKNIFFKIILRALQNTSIFEEFFYFRINSKILWETYGILNPLQNTSTFDENFLSDFPTYEKAMAGLKVASSSNYVTSKLGWNRAPKLSYLST